MPDGHCAAVLTQTPTAVLRRERQAMSRAPARRVLVDLSHAADGYVGVAQDLRLIFAMLAGIDHVEAAGLLMPTGRHDLPVVRAGRQDAAALTAAVLHCMERNWSRLPRRPFPLSVLQTLQMIRQGVRGRHALLPVSDAGQLNAIWRVLFAKTLPPAMRATVLQQAFLATDLSVSAIIDRVAHFPVGLPKRLAADGFDAVLFCMPRPVRLPPGVRQLVRFHDAVPVTDTDTIVGWKQGLAHSRLVRGCAPDAIFVCNSPQSREQLESLEPGRAERAVVIPCALAPPHGDPSGIDPALVARRHMTFRAINQDSAPAGWRAPPTGFRYVLSVSTLEPRKNFTTLVRAWERAAARGADDLRLVIVGSPGWREEAALAQMRPGVESGAILHLQNVPADELQALMRGAACFAFPSYNEGFGFSPLEALQQGVACAVSDIPVFRWIFGDAVLYVDPYDPESLARAIERLAGSAELRQSLGARAEPVLARFRPSAVREGWEALLETIRPLQPEHARWSG